MKLFVNGDRNYEGWPRGSSSSFSNKGQCGSLVYSDSSGSKQRVTDGEGCRSIQFADNLKEEGGKERSQE